MERYLTNILIQSVVLTKLTNSFTGIVFETISALQIQLVLYLQNLVRFVNPDTHQTSTVDDALHSFKWMFLGLVLLEREANRTMNAMKVCTTW